MKILQVNVTADKGSTGKIVYDIHSQLSQEGHKSIICYGRGISENSDNIIKLAPEYIMKLQSLFSKLTGIAYGGCCFSTANLIKIIKRENPDVVHLHCLNGYFVNIYKLLDYLKKNNIKTVLTLHAEFMYTAGCSYSLDCNQWIDGCCKNNQNCPQFNVNRPKSFVFNRVKKEWQMMKKSFENFNNLTICPVSDWVKSKAIKSCFFKDKKIITVLNGLNEQVFKYYKTKNLKQTLNLKNEKIVIYVTPNFNSPLKGGKYILSLAENLKDENIKIIIIGIDKSDYPNLPNNIIPIKRTENQAQLAQFYSMGDVTVLTSKKETFSMICAESLCCGTPVVGFKAGGPETISIEEYSHFVQQGDISALSDCVKDWVNLSFNKEDISKKAISHYNKKLMY